MKKLKYRLGILFFVLMACIIIFVGFLTAGMMKSNYIDTQKEQLLQKIEMIQITLSGKIPDANLAKTLSESSKNRLTITDMSGKVLVDSAYDAASLANHKNREEISAILNGDKESESIRKSESANEELLYVAVPFLNQQDEPIGVLRLSVSLAGIDQVIHQMWRSILYMILFTLAVSAALSFFLAKNVVNPIEDMMEVTNDLSNNKFNSRFNRKTYLEINQLGDTINHLAENLEGQMQELAQNETRMSGLINHLIIGVMLLDQQRNVQLINPAMATLLAEDSQLILNHPYTEVVKSFGLARLIEKAYRKNVPQNDEIHFYYPFERTLDANVVPIVDQNGVYNSMIVLLYDITDIRRLEKVRSDFVANASHELKTPITALKGFSETLLDGAKDDPVVLTQFLNIMHEESKRLDELITDILQLSKLEQEETPIALEEINVTDVAKSSLAILEKIAQKRHVQLTLEIPEQPVMMTAEKGRLQQILMNLLTNGINYTPEDGAVSLIIEEEQEYVILTVKDNGIGISENELSRIFERFYRVDKARSRHSGGTGLGLSIVKYLVENFHGEIQVESKLGLGTTFKITLPKTP